ncbi:hypothetical protein BJ741DRAFT_628604 [Chytriomyces cf. hyalinus JEL632]|nr:hypothetical protein BJ741DRAFT_628604 [Chytriomyces cf. hyalinus JEL632]
MRVNVNVAASFAAMSAVRTTAEAVHPRAIQELPQYAVKPAIISETVNYEYDPSRGVSEITGQEVPAVSATSVDAGIPTLPSTGPVKVEKEDGSDPTTPASELDLTKTTQSAPSMPPTATFPDVGTTTYPLSTTAAVNRADAATVTCEEEDTVDQQWNETTDPADEGEKVTTTAPAGGKAGYEAACSEASKGAGNGAGILCGNGVAATAPFGNIYVSGTEALVRGSILTGVIGIIFA